VSHQDCCFTKAQLMGVTQCPADNARSPSAVPQEWGRTWLSPGRSGRSCWVALPHFKSQRKSLPVIVGGGSWQDRFQALHRAEELQVRSMPWMAGRGRGQPGQGCDMELLGQCRSTDAPDMSHLLLTYATAARSSCSWRQK
jgi:hypothetical protein